MTRPRLAVLAGRKVGEGVLEGLAERQANIAFVMGHRNDATYPEHSKWNPRIEAVCARLHLPFRQEKKLTPELFSGVDLILNPFCDRIVPKAVLDLVPALNLHFGTLPTYGGRFIFPNMIFQGEKQTHLTVHWMAEAVDEGEIVAERVMPLHNNDTAWSAYKRATRQGTELLLSVFDQIEQGKLQKIAQPQRKKGYYTTLPNNGVLDFTWDEETIARFVRAMTFLNISSPLVSLQGELWKLQKLSQPMSHS